MCVLFTYWQAISFMFYTAYQLCSVHVQFIYNKIEINRTVLLILLCSCSWSTDVGTDNGMHTLEQ